MWVWTSGLLPATANNQQYKMTFKIDGELIDPDVVVWQSAAESVAP